VRHPDDIDLILSRAWLPHEIHTETPIVVKPILPEMGILHFALDAQSRPPASEKTAMINIVMLKEILKGSWVRK
jgi:hypothetical protein